MRTITIRLGIGRRSWRRSLVACGKKEKEVEAGRRRCRSRRRSAGHDPPHRHGRRRALPARPGERHAEDQRAGAALPRESRRPRASRASCSPCWRIATWSRRVAASKGQVAQAEANLRDRRTGATVPEQWRRRRPTSTRRSEALDAAQEAARQPPAAVQARRAGAQAGGRSAGGVRAGEGQFDTAQEHLQRAADRSARRSRSRPPRRRWRRRRASAVRARRRWRYSQIRSPDHRRGRRPSAVSPARWPVAGTPLLTVMDISARRGARQRAAEPGRHVKVGDAEAHHADRWRRPDVKGKVTVVSPADRSRTAPPCRCGCRRTIPASG